MRQTDAASLVLADLRQLAYERRAGQVECGWSSHDMWFERPGDFCPCCKAAL